MRAVAKIHVRWWPEPPCTYCVEWWRQWNNGRWDWMDRDQGRDVPEEQALQLGNVMVTEARNYMGWCVNGKAEEHDSGWKRRCYASGTRAYTRTLTYTEPIG